MCMQKVLLFKIYVVKNVKVLKCFWMQTFGFHEKLQ